MNNGSGILTEVICILLSITLIFSPVAFAVENPVPPQTNDEGLDLEKFARDYEKAAELIEDLLPQIPCDTFDLNVIVEQAHSEPTRLFKWVRDNTYLVPYRGLLRSGQGVLMDRVGNSLDRAMLLFQLLEKAGQRVRLARGNLSDEQLKALVEGRRQVPPEGALPRSQEATGENAAALIAKLAVKHGLDAAKLKRVAEEQAQTAKELREKTMERVASQTKALLSLLGDLPEKASADELSRPQGEAYKDHWWVQWNKDGRWIDFDPTLPNAKPAQTLTDVKTTLLPKDLDDEIKHRVEIQVIAETWNQGKLEETTLLNHSLIPFVTMGKRVVLTDYPVSWPKNLTPFNKDTTFELFHKALLEQREWMPVLRIGEHVAYERSITVNGIIDETPTLDRASVAGDAISSRLGGFAGMLETIGTPSDPTEEEASDQDRIFTAAWTQYVFFVPGQPTKEIRRQIFDLIGPAIRSSETAVPEPTITENLRLQRAMALLMETDILALSSQPSDNYISHLFEKAILANRNRILEIVHNIRDGNFADLSNALQKLTALPGASYGLALARTTWRHKSCAIYTDQPILFSYHKGLRINEQNHTLLFESFDIVNNSVALQPSLKMNPFRVRLEQGVLDTNAEALLLGEKRAGENTSEIFMKSLRQGIPWIIIRSVKDLTLSGIQLPSNLKASIKKDLVAGYMVGIPTAQTLPVEDSNYGWWRIDPLRGDALGINSLGWGSEMVEYMGNIGIWFIGSAACFKAADSQEAGVMCVVSAGFGLSFALASVAQAGSVMAVGKWLFGSAATGAGTASTFLEF